MHDDIVTDVLADYRTLQSEGEREDLLFAVLIGIRNQRSASRHIEDALRLQIKQLQEEVAALKAQLGADVQGP